MQGPVNVLAEVIYPFLHQMIIAQCDEATPYPSSLTGHISLEIALLECESRRVQGQDLRLHAQLAHATVDHLAILGARVQDGHHLRVRMRAVHGVDAVAGTGRQATQEAARQDRCEQVIPGTVSMGRNDRTWQLAEPHIITYT